MIYSLLVASPLQPLEDVMRNILDWLHTVIGLPWAWAIIVLTVLVRMLLVPLTVRQIHSMQNMQRFAPQMKEIQKRYKGDRQKANEELMKFYKEHNINPAASCLPMVAQIPVFISLYYVLRHFAEHPPGGNLEWLSLVDITNRGTVGWGKLLLVIYVLSQMSSTYFMATTMDKKQRYLMMGMPVIFVSFIMRFPTGLLLYWVTTNLWTVGQGLITRRLVPKTPAPSMFQRSKKPPSDGGGGNGAKREPPPPKPTPAATAPQQPRRVKRKKKKARR
ncbi:MAG TPA: YidC/Oxa1 family membrane protein insertase [Gaiellaceae bacterium]|nr:YidC/Oxa1 family membrane protein insertase [Gaiellaceae bacterium]